MFQEVANFVLEKGVTVGIILYFVWRDMNFTQKLEETLAVIKDYIMEGEKKE